MSNMARQHWPGVLYFGSLCVGAWYLMKWAHASYHHSISKDPAFYEAEARELLGRQSSAEIANVEGAN